MAVWLAAPDHASELAARLADGLVVGTDLLRDEDVHGVLDALVRDRIDKVPLAPLAGRVLQQLTREGRHEPLIDAGLKAAAAVISPSTAPSCIIASASSRPGGCPGPVEDRMVGRLLQRSRQVLDDMAAHPDHSLRLQLEAGLEKFAVDLQTSEAMRQRGEEIKAELLGQPQLRGFAAAVWQDIKEELRTQAERPGSELRTGLASMITQTGVRLRDDPQLAASAQRGLDAAVRTTLRAF